MAKELDLVTLFDMFKTEISKWPEERLSYKDRELSGGTFLREVNLDNNVMIARVVLDNENRLLQVIYPRLVLH